MIDLYHYTCQHRADMIEDTANEENFVLIPNQQLFMKAVLTWLTDMDEVDREALGLTGHQLNCDRGEVMYHVTEWIKEPVPWVGSIWHSGMDPFTQAKLHHNRDPRRWWVTDQVVRVERVER